jgi:hypothetical protein
VNLLNDPTAVPAYEKELLDGIIMAAETIGISESFKRLPVLKDEFLLAAHSLLLELIAPSAWAAPHLLHTLPLIGVLLTFQHGKCVQSSVHVLRLYCLSHRQMCMLAVNVSNPDRPFEDQSLALTALDIAKDALNYFGASRLLNCRIWTIFGNFWLIAC